MPWHINSRSYHYNCVREKLNFTCKRSENKYDKLSLSAIISKNSETTLQLVSKMTSVTNRIDLESVKEIFGRLRTSRKIKLPEDLTNSIDATISNNMTPRMEDYADELSEIR